MIKIDEKIKEIMENNPVALATVDEKGDPNVIAVAFVRIVDNNIVITNNYMAETLSNLRRNSSACLAVWNSDWEGYKIIGKVKYFESGEWFDFVNNMPENKDCPAKGAILMSDFEIRKLA